MRSAEIAGTTVIRIEEEPRTDVPVLYVHGVPDSSASWRPFLARTGGYALDLPGFGSSGKAADFDYSIGGYGRFLGGFVDHLGLDRVQLVMHDWGSVGLALAQERPELVERLVLIDAVPFLPDYRWHQIARIWRTPLLGELFQGFSSKWASKRIMRRMGAMREDAIGGYVDEAWQHFDHGTQRAILKLYRSAPPDVLARAGERLGDVTSPALVVWGEDDPYLPTKFAHAYADALGGDARVEIVPGAGHWVWIDEPKSVDLITGFLTGKGV